MDIEKEIENLKNELATIKKTLSVIAPHVEKSIDAENSLASHYRRKPESGEK